MLSFSDERALAAWARWCYSCQLPRTSLKVRQQARQIAIARGLVTDKEECKFGRKWYRGFAIRHNLKMKRGQRSPYAPPTVKDYNIWMNEWKEVRKNYALCDTYNADEVGFARHDTKG